VILGLILNKIKKGFWLHLDEIYRPLFSFLGHEGVKVVEEEWDYIIVLDACMYDIFEDVNWIDGKLESIISKGSGTPEWIGWF